MARGVISAGGAFTAEAGARMLGMGGNAVDAAVAAAFASFCTEVGVVHWGGAGMAQLYDPQTGVSKVYDFFCNMPGLGAEGGSGALDFREVSIDFGATKQYFHLGRGSVAVPGNIFGLCAMAQAHGRLPLATLLEPALEATENGIEISDFQANTCGLLQDLYLNTAGMRRVFEIDGRMIAGGERLFIPDLHGTLSTLAQEGADYLRYGGLGRALIQDQVQNGGLLTARDLADYQVYEREPIVLPYRDFEILLPPPPSTGGVLIAFSLKLMAAFDLGDLSPDSADYKQLFYEVMAATSQARVTWDEWAASGSSDVALTRFLAPEHVGQYIEKIRQALASGRPLQAMPTPKGPANTSHLSVIDGDGMAVSLTTTAGESAGYVVPNTGFIPNNMLGEADLNPHGWHKWAAGERIATMMAPTIVRQRGQTRLVVGSGGSERIRSAIMQTLINVLDFGLTLDEAVSRPRIHVENGVLQCELGYKTAALDQLETRGYAVNRWQISSIYFGGAHSVSRTKNGRLVAAGDRRRDGSVNYV